MAQIQNFGSTFKKPLRGTFIAEENKHDKNIDPFKKQKQMINICLLFTENIESLRLNTTINYWFCDLM